MIARFDGACSLLGFSTKLADPEEVPFKDAVHNASEHDAGSRS
jgi:hypothetical protein